MDIFNKWFQAKKPNNHEVAAFASGDMCRLEAVPDEAFANLMFGDGQAIRPDNGAIVAPLAGEITMIFPTKHAFSIKTPEGIELLIHIGVDTVKLKGKGYNYLKKANTTVYKGEKIVEVDLDFIKESGYDPIAMMIVVNPNGYSFTYEADAWVNKGKSVVARYFKA